MLYFRIVKFAVFIILAVAATFVAYPLVSGGDALDVKSIESSIHTIGRMETAKYTATINVHADNEQSAGVLAFTGLTTWEVDYVAHVVVVAGVDFNDVTISMDNGVAYVHVPDAFVFDDLPVVNETTSYVAYTDIGAWSDYREGTVSVLERNAADQAKRDAVASGLIALANDNAKAIISDAFSSSGIQVVFD